MMAKMPKYSAEKLRKARVLIVEDQPMMREKLVELISSQSDLICCGDTDNPGGAINLIPSAKPNLVLTGLALQESHGLEFIKDLRMRYPRVPCWSFPCMTSRSTPNAQCGRERAVSSVNM